MMNVMTAPKQVVKQTVNLTLNTDIVVRARALVGNRNLSATVDGLLETFVTENAAKRIGHKEKVAQWVAAHTALVNEFGSPADEHDLY